MKNYNVLISENSAVLSSTNLRKLLKVALGKMTLDENNADVQDLITQGVLEEINETPQEPINETL